MRPFLLLQFKKIMTTPHIVDARRFHDLTAVLLVAAGNGIGLGAAIHIYPDRVAAGPLAIWGSVLVAIISLVILLLIPRWSYTPDELTPP